jgi:hypothetical protein
MIKLLSKFDVQPLLDEYHRLEKDIQWTEYGHKGRQTGLQHRTSEDPWSSAVGKNKGNELDHVNLNPFFTNTVFESLINQFKLIKTRLMWVGPYACYSMHRDTTPRIHIPLITNPECYFVFKQGLITHLSASNVYWIDTTRFHTFMNCSNQHRLHLVGVVEK